MSMSVYHTIFKQSLSTCCIVNYLMDGHHFSYLTKLKTKNPGSGGLGVPPMGSDKLISVASQ
jgi:hypothetical protein